MIQARTVVLVSLGVLAIGGGAADGQSTSPRSSDGSLFVAGPFPASFDRLDVDGYAVLEGSFDVKNNGTNVTFAPFLLNPTYAEVLSELRLQVSQAEGRTGLGVSLTYNPRSPRGHRGARLWMEAIGGAVSPNRELVVAYGDAVDSLMSRFWRQDPVTARWMDRQRELEAAGVPPTDPRMRTANDSLAAAKRAREIHLIDHAPQTLGQVLADSAAFASRGSQALAASRTAGATSVLRYREALVGAGPPEIRLSYVKTLFPVIGGGDTDANGNGIPDHGRISQGDAVTAVVDWRLDEATQVAGLVSWTSSHESAERTYGLDRGPDTSLGFAFTVGTRLTILDEDYQSSKAYLESLFVPELVAGLSLEGTRCREKESVGCGSERVVRETTVTPFLDVKIAKAAQFRFGAPFTFRSVAGEDSDVALRITSLLKLELGLPGS